MDPRTREQVRPSVDHILAGLRAAWTRSCEAVIEFEARVPRAARSGARLDEHGALLKARSAAWHRLSRACVLRLELDARGTSDAARRALDALAREAHEARWASLEHAASSANSED